MTLHTSIKKVLILNDKNINKDSVLLISLLFLKHIYVYFFVDFIRGNRI
jgi:hypothetical protein